VRATYVGPPTFVDGTTTAYKCPGADDHYTAPCAGGVELRNTVRVACYTPGRGREGGGGGKVAQLGD
jgi:hypothetical protein